MKNTSHKHSENLEITEPSTATITIMEWDIKTINQPRSDIRRSFYFGFGAPVLYASIFTGWLWDDMAEKEIMFDLWMWLCITTTVVPLIFLAILRQKTVFNYKIHSDHGEVEHQLYFPDFAEGLFQGIAVFAILVFVGVAMLTGSLLFLFGPAAIAVGSAMTLMSWEKPPVEHQESMQWIEHDFVTVDRKHLIIVAHYTDTTTGFKARFPNKELFEQYLAFLHTAVAPHAEFTEKVWEW